MNQVPQWAERAISDGFVVGYGRGNGSGFGWGHGSSYGNGRGYGYGSGYDDGPSQYKIKSIGDLILTFELEL